LHHKVRNFSSGTGSPGWSRKKGRKRLWWWWCRVHTCKLLVIKQKNVKLKPRIYVLFMVTLCNRADHYIFALWFLSSSFFLFSERELTFTFALCYRPSVCRLSVTFVRPTQAVQIFGNISTALGTWAIRWYPLKILRRSSQGNPSAGGVKHKRGSKI